MVLGKKVGDVRESYSWVEVSVVFWNPIVMRIGVVVIS